MRNRAVSSSTLSSGVGRDESEPSAVRRIKYTTMQIDWTTTGCGCEVRRRRLEGWTKRNVSERGRGLRQGGGPGGWLEHGAQRGLGEPNASQKEKKKIEHDENRRVGQRALSYVGSVEAVRSRLTAGRKAPRNLTRLELASACSNVSDDELSCLDPIH